MNKKQTKSNVEQNRKKYICMSGCNYKFRSKNAIFISTTNKLNHEVAKFVGAYMIKKYGDIKFTNRIIGAIKILEEAVVEDLKDFEKNPSNFITEAVPKVDKDRRVDLVRLEDEQWIEFENNHKIKKEGALSIYI